METELESEVEDIIPSTGWWSLHGLLKMAVHKEKPLFRAIASFEGGAVVAIVCIRGGRDEELINIATLAWTIYNLLLERNTTGNLIKTAMKAWFLSIHKMATIDYSEYNQETRNVLFQDKMNGNAIGSKSQEAIAEGLLDLSILDKPPEIHRGAMAGGKYYGS